MGERTQSVRRNGKERAVVKRKDADWEELLGARDEHTKERCMEAYKEEVRKVKSCIYVYIEARGKFINRKLFGRR